MGANKAGRSVEAIRFLFAPGRKAIAEVETKKIKEEKRRRLEAQRITLALECAKKKRRVRHTGQQAHCVQNVYALELLR